MKGLFVTLEGPEGGGKSTLLHALASKIPGCVTTREPGAGTIGGQIRKLVLESDGLVPRAELFLFLADRAQHVAKVIEPALAEGRVVLCDRHADSTVVYQGYARGGDIEQLRQLNRIATDGRTPDLTFLLDVPPTLGLRRQEGIDRLGGMPLQFHERVREGFLAEARREPERWVILDAEEPAELVAQQAWKVLQSRRV
ncbi:MAG: dTMP kinase [Chthonomonas sp.]|nr:dTMP kinase [Chthonomonas sp.]